MFISAIQSLSATLMNINTSKKRLEEIWIDFNIKILL
jgi:hypothetical protein